MSDAPDRSAQAPVELSALVIPLLRGVLYQEGDAGAWQALLQLQARVRDYVAVLGLELIVDEAEGYAFLRSVPDTGDAEEVQRPRLVARRPLSFPVSLLLALLRKKLAEFDAGSGREAGNTRLLLSRDDVVDMLHVFLPAGTDQARFVDQVDAHLNKAVDLGFVRRLRPVPGQPPMVEVRRILKAFVDGQWLFAFGERLAAYQARLQQPPGDPTGE